MPFTYETYRDPYVGTIGQLMQAGPQARAQAALQVGNAQAQGALQSGNAWAGAIQTVGQAIANVPGQIQQIKQQEAANQLRDLQLAQAKRETTAADRLEATKRQVNSLMQDPDVINADGTFNLKGMARKAGTLPNGAVGPTEAPDMIAMSQLIEPINAHITQARDAKLQYDTQRQNAFAQMAGRVYALGQQTGDYLGPGKAGVAAAVKAGLLTEQESNQFLAQLVDQPEAALQGAMALSTAAPIKLGEKERLVSSVDPTQTLVAAAPEKKPDYTINGVRFSGTTNQPYGPAVPVQETPQAAETARHNQAMERIGLMTAGRQEAAQTEIARHNAAMEQAALNKGQNRPVLSSDANRITDIDTGIKEADALNTAIHGQTGTASWLGAQVPDFVTSATGLGTESKQRQAVIDRVRQLIGKTLEGGVLRKEDEIKYSKILPTIGDPPEVTAAKLANLRETLVRKRQTSLESLADAGYNVAAFTTRGAPPPPGTPPSAPAAPPAAPAPRSFAVGEVVTVRGQPIRITAIHPDGTFDGDPVR